MRATLAGRPSVRGEIVLMFVPAAVEAAREGQVVSVAKEVRAVMKEQGIAEKDAAPP